MKRNAGDYGRIESTFGKGLGAEIHRPRPSGPRSRRPGDEIFNSLEDCRPLIEKLCPGIAALRTKEDLTRADCIKLERSGRYARLIVDYFQLRKPSWQIVDEWNETLKDPEWDDELNAFVTYSDPIEPPRGGRWTPRKIEHMIEGLRRAVRGLRMNGQPRSHGKRGRPQKYFLMAA